jgi:hypothetical protein
MIVYDFFLTFETERIVVWDQAGSKVNATRVLWVVVGVHSSKRNPVLRSTPAPLRKSSHLLPDHTIASLRSCELIPKPWVEHPNL